MKKRWKIAVAVMGIALVGLPVCAADSVDVQASVWNVEQGKAAAKNRSEKVLSEEEEKEVEELIVKKVPDKTQYLGPMSPYILNANGMQIQIRYSDGTDKDLTCKENSWYDENDEYFEDSYNIRYEYSGSYLDPDAENLVAAYGDQTAEISYGGKSEEIAIHVEKITKLEVVSQPVAEYYEGYRSMAYMRSMNEDLDIRGMALKVTLENGESVQLSYKRKVYNAWSYREGWYDDEDNLYEEVFDNVEYAGEYAEGGYAAGIQKGKLDFNGITVYFEVKVKGVKNISIVSLPQYREFYGESVDQDVIVNKADGLKLKVDFADGSSEIVKYKGEYNYGWENEAGEDQNCVIKLVYKGKYRNNKANGYFAYGTWPVDIVLAGKHISYNVDIKRYDVKVCGKLNADQQYQFSLEEKQENVFTFTPTETAIYNLEFLKDDEESGSDCEMLVKLGERTCKRSSNNFAYNDDREMVLQAGLTYEFRFAGIYIDKENKGIKFILQKKDNISVSEIQQGTVQNLAYVCDQQNRKYYSFVPESTGTYTISYKEDDPHIDTKLRWYTDDMNILLTSSEDDSESKNYGEITCYLQKGQKYIFEAEANCYEDHEDTDAKRGNIQIEVKKKEENHSHAFEACEEISSTCLVSGVKIEKCKICGITSAKEIAKAHLFGEYRVTRQATIFADGSEERTCSVCGRTESRKIPKLPATIHLSKTSITLKTGQSTTAVKVSGLTAGDSIDSWKSNKPQVANVNKNGKITAGKKTGTATITVTLKSGTTATVKVKVQKKKVATKKITVDKKNITLKKKKSYKIKVKLQPITASDKVTFTSSNKKVATVNAKGVVKAKKAGTAKITVKAGKKKAVVTVKVK